MKAIALAKRTLARIGDEYFRLNVSASTGGKCSDGWGDSLELALSKGAILYLLKQRIGNDDLFQELSLEEIDIDSVIYDMTMEAAWPDGGPSASVNDIIPNELSELSGELELLDESDEEAVMAVREKLKQVSDGKYTFSFTVEASDYYFTEGAEEAIELTAKEALGILHGHHGMDEIFEGICEESYDEDFINDKADELGFASDYDTFSYGSDCEQLDAYLSAWEYIIDSILFGGISEEDIDSWLEYFDDSNNYEMAIADWYKERADE